MPENNELTSQLKIKIDGTEVQREMMSNLVSVMVDQHAYLPAMVNITLLDSDFKILDKGPFDLTKEIEILAERDNSEVKLFKGEITALEQDYQEGMIAQLNVQGYDKSHRLFRETKSEAHLNKKDSDLANSIAGNAGLSKQIETTSTVYDHIFQDNQTDLEFLKQRAWRIGYECFVEEGKLYFRKPPTTGRANVELTWGDDLQTFRPRMGLAEQVDEVMVQGWDEKELKAILGQARNGKLYPKVQESKNGKSWASSFGTGKKIIVDQPVINQAEADVLAQARLDELSGTFIEAEGMALRRPDIKAGALIKLEGLGKRFSGTYLVTNAVHVYGPEGMRTTFRVSGSRKGLLAEQVAGLPDLVRWEGVVTAIVTNNDDPEDRGRVKIKYPWLEDRAESWWARVIGAGAAKEAGFYALPEVGDEVLVAFAHGDFNYPYVLGGLWNGKHAIPDDAMGAGAQEKHLVRTWQSKKKHKISLDDTANQKIHIETTDGHQFILDDANQSITLQTSGGLVLKMEDNGQKITMESGGDVELKSTGNMTIEATGNLKMKASANVDLEAGAIMKIKGSMVNIKLKRITLKQNVENGTEKTWDNPQQNKETKSSPPTFTSS